MPLHGSAVVFAMTMPVSKVPSATRYGTNRFVLAAIILTTVNEAVGAAANRG
jgi:hypothetical protein